MEFCEFLSEDTLIEIVPNFKYPEVLNLINGDFGPFKPAMPTQVPIWMALNLFTQQKCKIILPEWISDLDRYEEEQASSPGLIKMPCNHWREVLKLLCQHNIPLNNKAANNLIELRDNILKKSVDTLLSSVVSMEEDQIAQVKIKNITKFELATIKKLIVENLAFSKSMQKI